MNSSYAGIDLHKDYSYITVVDQTGKKVSQGKIDNQVEKLQSFFNKLANPKAVVEATFAWGWITDLLTEQGVEVILGHPQKLKAIASARIKTDKIDSEVLADLLRADLIPPAYLASKKERELKDLLRLRCSLVNTRASFKRRVHAVLHKHNLRVPKNKKGKELTDLFGKVGRSWLVEVIEERSKISDEYTSLELTEYLGVIDQLSARLEKVNQVIRKASIENPTAQFLEKLPGIGYYSSLTLAIELGYIHRFRSSGAVCSYAGLTASTYQSGKSTRHGRIKHGNKYIRWILIEAVPKAIKKDKVLNRFYQRLKAKKGSPKAKVATARKMLAQIYFSLKRQRYFLTDQGSPGFFSGN